MPTIADLPRIVRDLSQGIAGLPEQMLVRVKAGDLAVLLKAAQQSIDSGAIDDLSHTQAVPPGSLRNG